jgi:hypothetical protein
MLDCVVCGAINRAIGMLDVASPPDGHLSLLRTFQTTRQLTTKTIETLARLEYDRKMKRGQWRATRRWISDSHK